MVRAAQASYIALPKTPNPPDTVYAFMCARFTAISADIWRARFLQGKVHWHDGESIGLTTAYRPQQRVYYYREVAQEPVPSVSEAVLYEDERIVMAYKPPFMALHPSGGVVNQCLVNRLRLRLGCDELVPAHRLDRATAGIVLLIKQSAHRDAYHGLFRSDNIAKTYQALAPLTSELRERLDHGLLTLPMRWTVKNRLVKGNPSFTMMVVEGEANSHSEIALVAAKDGIGRFELSPVTGKTHQLRVHMHSLGMPILNDRCYPVLQPKADDDTGSPLMLLAQRLAFTDPICHRRLDIQVDGLCWPY